MQFRSPVCIRKFFVYLSDFKIMFFFSEIMSSLIFSLLFGYFVCRFSCISIWWCYFINIIQTNFTDQNVSIVSLADNITVQNEIAISKETTTNLSCRIFSFSRINLCFSFIVFLFFSIISSDDQLAKPPQRFVWTKQGLIALKHGSSFKEREKMLSWMIQFLYFFVQLCPGNVFKTLANICDGGFFSKYSSQSVAIKYFCQKTSS